MTKKTFTWPWLGFMPNKKDHIAMSGAYTLTHVATGKIYIGSTISIYGRLYKHIDELRRNIHGCKEMQKLYNEDPVFEVFFYLTGIREEREKALKDCRDLEQLLLDTFDDRSLLLNTAIDARSSHKGLKFNQKHRERIASALRGKSHSQSRIERAREVRKTPAFIARAKTMNLGKVRSDETKQKLREFKLLNSPQVRIEGVLYKNTTEASEKLGIHKDTVTYRVKSSRFPNYSYV